MKYETGAVSDFFEPFSADGFRALAKAGGYPLENAAWMAAQPLAYGIDAGHAIDDDGNLIDDARLDRIVKADAWKTSAVLIPVLAKEPEVTVLLTLRTSHLSSHSGQIAFPGGKIEPSDANPVATALREAEEEIGLPRTLAEPLAVMDLHKTGTGYRIVPVIAMIDPRFTPLPDPNEVADVFEVPLSFLMAEQNHIAHIGQYKGQSILFNSLTYNDWFIWGATAAIIKNMHDRLFLGQKL